MRIDEAGIWIGNCAESARMLAAASVRDIRETLHPLHRVTGASILQSSGGPLPDLPGILASHPRIHMAEGVFFREAIRQACESLGVPVFRPVERDLLTEAASKTNRPAEKVLEAATELGRPFGRPWTQDEKLAAIAAWLSLSMSSAEAVLIPHR